MKKLLFILIIFTSVIAVSCAVQHAKKQSNKIHYEGSYPRG